VRSRNPDLTTLQLEVVKHVANGYTLAEIAKEIDRSLSHCKKQADIARRKTGAKTLPQLVSIVIARGQLEWSPMDAGRVITQRLPGTPQMPWPSAANTDQAAPTVER
jgi:DNA-binding CsgD family transcriptional regulator